MNKFKVIIAGGRFFNDAALLCRVCDHMLSRYKPEDVEVVSGACRIKELIDKGIYGADVLGECYALSRGMSVREFPADWKRYGKSAGPRRNADMASYADALIAFWDGKSGGTGGMIELAKAGGLKVKVEVVEY